MRRRRRVMAILGALAVLAAAVLFVAAGGGGSHGGSYRVRAVFDNANFDIPREDGEAAGVKVGEIDTGLAGNGTALRQAIRRADPALQQTDRVLAILASQNRTLADLAQNSDTALAPLARERARAADFITKASATGAATAARGGDLERVLQKLPGFLRTLTPTARQLG